MHELFTQVLSNKDLSKVSSNSKIIENVKNLNSRHQFVQAGDLFSVPDEAVVNELTEVINAICEIASSADYVNNDNDQSVVEICITRVTSAIRSVLHSLRIFISKMDV